MNIPGRLVLQILAAAVLISVGGDCLAAEHRPIAKPSASPPRPQNQGAAARVEVFRESPEWRPIHWEPARILPGSAIDFTRFLDAPAGKWGPVICRNGQLVFSATHKPLRLYGTDITHGLPYLDKPRCEQLADYLAACGYNGVRLHNYTFAKGVLPEPGATTFTPEARDQLDYFFACLKKRGIYFTLPINSWGFFKAGDVQDVPEYRGRAFRFESNALLPISSDAQRWFKAFALDLLGHRNRYTGMALKDDPALVSVELANEDSLFAVLQQMPEFLPIYRQRCAKQLQSRSGQTPTAEQVEKELPGYVLDLQSQFFQTMKTFLRDAGVRQPLTDLNFRDNMVYAIPRSQLDYVDIHAYWSLYKSLSGWPPQDAAAYRQTWTNPNTVGWGASVGAVAGRLFDKPYMCSEFNGCYATPYWIYTGPTEATLAGLQGWNGVFRCGPAAQPARFFKAAPLRRIETTTSPWLLLSERIGALLFAHGEVPPLPVKLPLVLTPEYLLAQLEIGGGPKHPSAYQQLAFEYQLGVVLLDGRERLDAYPCLIAPPDMKLPAALSAKKVLRADAHLAARLREVFPADVTRPEPALKLDRASGLAQISTLRTETFLLPAEVGTAHGTCVQIAGNQSVAVCFAGSLDGRPLSAARRVLVLYLTDAKNSGTEVEHEPRPSGSVIVRRPGELPLLLRQGLVQLTFRHAEPALPRIWALKYDGSRATPIAARRTSDGFRFDAAALTAPEVFSAYELNWDEP